ncbi:MULTISPECIES: hypothetical protein [Clostridium]|uniref:Uncharacterized protein n=1 Tax=Clostridium cibarium TaxID=2762247 RepID=A0ABR8PYL7_9CLOT|nr:MULTISPECIES: hypothetical protein [Clostridium]MBD7913265.1 hypothetical protein [Clostridium cibarium]
MAIRIKVAKVQEDQLVDEDIKREVDSIQQFFNLTNFEFAEGTVNFVLIKGIYSHIKRSMLVIGVYVNKTDNTVYGISSELNLKFNNLEADIMSINTTFPEEFVGKLDVDDGLLVHLDIPVVGLNEDAEFSVKDISGELNNVKLIERKE